MGIWDRLKKELIDIVEWTDDSSNTLVHRFERFNNEIKWGAKLIVREGQSAVFVNMGKIADVFTPGMYTLDSKNLPILSTLLGWKYGFESPFKCEVYFVNTRKFPDQKWGTMNPVMLRDAEFGPVRLRAFGTYVFRVNDPAVFLRDLVGTEGRFTTDEIINQFRNIIVTRLGDAMGESRIAVLDLAAHYNELGDFLTGAIGPEFGKYGVELSHLLVENVSLPPEVEQALDKRSSMGVIGNMHAYTQYQAAEALRDAARNQGAAGQMSGLGVGMIMANTLGQSVSGAAASAVPPPMPGAAGPVFHVAINGQPTGPFGAEAVRERVASGQVTRETLVWKPGLAGWMAASQVPEVAAMFAAIPPPVPPATPGA
ncbi:MAG: SPFH domain-containing protein [Phycisphaerae bacterium]|nr:SPFH domain-containing protein [Phycisphaerae bacterium]